MQKGKVIDFLLGVVIGIASGKLIGLFFVFTFSLFSGEIGPGSIVLSFIVIAGYAICYILLSFYFWKRRRYISYGIILILMLFVASIFLSLPYGLDDITENIFIFF